ncbi:hypothetical protein [Saccharothrix australiensis]|nr:hypothetical protein [Saccharothrix australiensis]
MRRTWSSPAAPRRASTHGENWLQRLMVEGRYVEDVYAAAP